MANRSMLARATDGTEAPTPGYLYLDIAKNAGSSPMVAQEVAQYLTRRLSTKQNPNVKHKCLKVIAKTASSSITRGQFQRMLAQDAPAVAIIKECLQFRGPPDPARGDEPYQKVRTAAKEALDAIYSDAPTSTQSQIPTGNMGGGGGGIPSANYGGGISGGGGGPRRMEGIGNPMFQDPRMQKGPPDTMDVLREAGRTIKNMIEDPLASRVQTGPPSHGHSGGGGGMQGFGGGGFSPPGRSELSQNTGGAWNMASNRGSNAITGNMDSYHQQKQAQKQAFGWASKNASGASVSSGGVGGSWGATAAATTTSSNRGMSVATAARQHPVGYGGSTNSGMGGTASADGQYERNLILELCPPGGVKAEPPSDKLLRFQQAIPSLNPDLVCPALLDCLEDGQPWIMRGKALCVMRTCIEFGIGQDGTNKYADFFFECRGEVEPLVNHNRPAIREPAKQILQLLGIATPVSPSKASTRSAVAAAPVAPPADLLDFTDTTATAAAAAPAPPPAPSTSGGGGSLFGGLKMQSSKEETTTVAPQQQQVAAGGSFSEAMAPPPGGGGSAFGFMQAPAATAEAPTGSAFGFMQSNATTAPAVAPSSSAPAVTKPDSNASAFDFMEPPKPTPLVPVSPARKPATFDPLAQDYQPSPTTVNKQAMMAQQQQMSAAAMYSQQQMLMMQHQMQQMQMAAMAMNNASTQQQQRTRQQMGKTNVMVPQGGGMATTSSFSFLDIGAQPPSAASKKDKKFDFIKDALKDEQKK